MNFAAMVLSVGVAGAILAYNMQGPAIAANETLVAAMRPSVEITGSIGATAAPANAIRLIDLRSGATCKMARPETGESFTRVPLGPECAKAPQLAGVAYWRTTQEGSLIMADRGGQTVLEFVPGDGVLYESVFPSNELITIVPARG
ncbi:hypothetical protein [Aureimonas populi]|uniref:Alkaline proteinase inhibitor/ Outer membrane lipoprotein Omp19 domain-containing protein n=1 Tax=Aureimonas populi TaxID=1701758 RepID=A0ABW5CGN2_9HYPH|nr:hypothetical protein [Aureimonas populi]